MYLSEIEISDLGPFRGTHRTSLARADGGYAGWTVFAGRNGSGKTTLLRAIAATLLGSVGPFELYLPVKHRSGSIDCWVLGGERDEGACGLQHARLEWTTVRNADGQTRIEEGRKLDPGGPKSGLWGSSFRDWFLAGYGPFRHLGATASSEDRDGSRWARVANLFREASPLAGSVEWLQHLQLRAYEQKPGAEELVRDALRLLNDGLLPDGATVLKVDSDGLWIRRDQVDLALQQVSDGYRTVTALVLDLVRRLVECFGSLALSDERPVCPHEGVVLIDEVDAHMHVAWQQKIGFWLTEHFPNLQFLVTTHSPFICQAASSRGIVRLPAPGEDRRMEVVDDRLYTSIVNGGADDAVMSELFGLEHAHSPHAEALRTELAGLEVKMMTGTATDADRAAHRALAEKLPDDVGEEADRKLRAVARAISL
jgi:energy-coupling factor transporter ATP-binding protein EcfA2